MENKRLTKEDILKFPNTTCGRAVGKRIANQVVCELLQYKQLEEELVCPLDKLLEANEIYVLDMDDKLKKHKIIGLNFKEKLIYFWMDFCPMYLSFNEYKSMYWLKEDRSE